MPVVILGRKASGFVCSRHTHTSLCGGKILCYKFDFRTVKEEKETWQIELSDLQQKIEESIYCMKTKKKSVDEGHLSSASKQEPYVM
jgi:hypothetical protein